MRVHVHTIIYFFIFCAYYAITEKKDNAYRVNVYDNAFVCFFIRVKLSHILIKRTSGEYLYQMI